MVAADEVRECGCLCGYGTVYAGMGLFTMDENFGMMRVNG